jgi:hypothetical protein
MIFPDPPPAHAACRGDTMIDHETPCGCADTALG